LAHANSIRHISAAKAFGIERNSGAKTVNSLVKDKDGLFIKITPKDREVANYIRAKEQFISPTELGMKIKGHNKSSASAWALRSINKLLSLGMVERNKFGHYRWLNK